MEHTTSVILARVSSKSQEDEGYSLDSQLKLLTGYFESKGLPVIKIFKITETASKEQGRKVFHEMLDFLHKNNVYHLGVEKTDRLTRNFRDALAIDDWLETDSKRMLHAVKENLLLHKGAKSDVKFMWNIHLAVAKKYTDNLREEAMKGWAEKLAQGWLPASPPPGYITVTENGKRIHVPDPKTQAIMQRMFRLYLEPSHSIQSITTEMELLGIRTRMGRPYSKSHVQRILNNPFYIGINRFDGKDYPGAQQSIISQELFNKVQRKMHSGRPMVLKQHNPVLKNIIFCENCGAVVTWQLQKGYYYGACQRKSANCRGKKLLREDRVEAIIMAHLQQLVSPSQAVIDWVAATVRAQHQTSFDNRERMLASIQVQLDRLKRMEDQLYDDKLAGEISREKYDVKFNQFKAQKADLQAQQTKVANSVAHGLEQRLVILELSQKAASIYQTKTPEQKRLIITKLFAHITASNGNLSVTYTNFSQTIAQKVLKTHKLLGGVK
jgi:site-specific DNA recombinase